MAFDSFDDARLKRVEAKLDLLPGALNVSERLARIESKLDQLIVLAKSIGGGMTDEDVDLVVSRINASAANLDATAKP